MASTVPSLPTQKKKGQPQRRIKNVDHRYPRKQIKRPVQQIVHHYKMEISGLAMALRECAPHESFESHASHRRSKSILF